MLSKIKRYFKKNKSIRLNNSSEGETSSELLCKCGKQKVWIIENKETQPCPECGRKYIGYYDKKNLTIAGKEIVC